MFKTVYIPEQAICVDEALCPWRGRLSFRVYMKDKPTKWGIKLYELCESRSGYVWNMEVMCSQPGISNKPHDVVLRLLDNLKDKGFVLYADNYYTSPALADALVLENTALVGTVRSNRVGMPKDLVTAQFKPGDVAFRRQDKKLVVRWKDKRDVYVLSTIHRPVMRKKRSRTETKRKPTAVIDYTANMGGVDHSDQMVAYHPMHRKSLKWWKKLTFHLLTLTMIQAHCLFLKVRKEVGKPPLTLQEFVMSVCADLASQPDTEPTGAAAPAGDGLLRLRDRHFLQDSTYKQCHVCYTKMKAAGATREQLKNKVKRTKYACKQCKIALCVTPCHEVYHTKENYAS